MCMFVCVSIWLYLSECVCVLVCKRNVPVAVVMCMLCV